MCFKRINIIIKFGGWDMKKELIASKEAPKAIGPYSQAVKVGNLIFISGQIPINPKSGLMPQSIEEQTIQSIENIGAILKEAGSSYKDVVKTTVLLKNLEDFEIVNNIYGNYFSEGYPARCCFEVSKLPKDAGIEIEAIAICK